MVPQLMEKHTRYDQVTKKVQRKDKRRPTSNCIVDHDLDRRRRSALFPMIETQASVATVLPTSYTPGFAGAYRSRISENNRPKTAELPSGNRRQQSFDRWTNPPGRSVLTVRLVNRCHFQDCAADGRCSRWQDDIPATMVHQITRISKERGGGFAASELSKKCAVSASRQIEVHTQRSVDEWPLSSGL